MCAKLAARVVQCLVERAASAAEALGEDVDGHAVQREGDEHLPLVRGQGSRIARCNASSSCACSASSCGWAGRWRERPGLRLQGDLAPLPRPPAQLHGRLQEGELVGPGREAAVAAEVVEPPEHAHQRVVGGLHGDVGELVAAQVRERGAAAGHLEAGRAQQQGMQAPHGVVVDRAPAPEAAEPFARLGVEASDCGGPCHGPRVYDGGRDAGAWAADAHAASLLCSCAVGILTASSGGQPRARSSRAARRSTRRSSTSSRARQAAKPERAGGPGRRTAGSGCSSGARMTGWCPPGAESLPTARKNHRRGGRPDRARRPGAGASKGAGRPRRRRIRVDPCTRRGCRPPAHGSAAWSEWAGGRPAQPARRELSVMSSPDATDAELPSRDEGAAAGDQPKDTVKRGAPSSLSGRRAPTTRRTSSSRRVRDLFRARTRRRGRGPLRGRSVGARAGPAMALPVERAGAGKEWVRPTPTRHEGKRLSPARSPGHRGRGLAQRVSRRGRLCPWPGSGAGARPPYRPARSDRTHRARLSTRNRRPDPGASRP